jgi:ATP-dependent exoDNAse (exonuclease V) beta subunit
MNLNAESNQLNDSSARIEALDPSQSFIVSAPAGSGKTGLITQRMLRLLATVENPEEILCITFTRKAAAEMRQRIFGALVDAQDKPKPHKDFELQTWELAQQVLKRNNEKDWNLLDIPYRLRIKTIDSFCHYVAKQFMFDSGSGELPEQSEFPDGFYQIAARDLLDQLENHNPTSEALKIVLSHMGNDLKRCETLFADMLGKRDQWLPHIFSVNNNQDYFQEVIEQLISDKLTQTYQQLLPLAGELIELADYAGCNATEKSPEIKTLAGISSTPSLDQQGLGQWKNLFRLLVTKDKKHPPRKTVNRNQGFPADNEEQKQQKKRMMSLLADFGQDQILQALVLDSMYLPEIDGEHDQQEILHALGILLPQLAAILKITFQQQGQSDYSEITLAALEALDPNTTHQQISDITLKLDYQIKHILVDEFQDTSGSQMKLLEHLVNGWELEDGRTLFLVGDAMQSLYSFRDARVGLFINAQRYPIGPIQCKPLNLSTNFRSQQGIVEWVNQQFKTAFPATANINRGAVPYNPSIAFKPAGDQQAVYFNGYNKTNNADYLTAEAQDISSLCQKIQIQNSDHSIAILVRNRGHLKQIIPALIEAKLNWEAIDIDPLADRMPVVDLMSLTRALISPADRIAWLALLRAPFCGLSLQDLVALTNDLDSFDKQPNSLISQLIKWQQSPSKFTKLTETGKQILQRIVPIILTAWQHRSESNLRDLVEQLWINLGGPASLINPRDLFDSRSYLDLLEISQQAGTLVDWNEFKKAVDKLYAQPIANNRDSGSAPIQIMTIHKSKGLEFDHVILPNLTKEGKGDDNDLLRWQEQVDDNNHNSLLLAALGAYDEDDNDPIYSYLKHEQRARSLLENTRVLYVAATRAIQKLYLFGELKPKKEGWEKPTDTSLLACIWPSIVDSFNQSGYEVKELLEQERTELDVKKSSASNSFYRALPSDFVPQRMPQNMMNLGVSNHKKKAQQNDLLDQRARHLGTILHRTLKQIGQDGIDNWPQQRRADLNIFWTTGLKQAGLIVSPAELESLNAAIETMLADEKGLWILDNHVESHCEQELAYFDTDSQTVKTSIIDRTFVENDTRWIIDYKYSRPNDNETAQQFIQRQTEAYSWQLKHYAQLYRHIDNYSVRCALYFPQTAVFIEVAGN